MHSDLSIVAAVTAFLYLLPALIAFGRTHQNAASICVVNVFLGWTLVGWVVALAWAVGHVAKVPRT